MWCPLRGKSYKSDLRYQSSMQVKWINRFLESFPVVVVQWFSDTVLTKCVIRFLIIYKVTRNIFSGYSHLLFNVNIIGIMFGSAPIDKASRASSSTNGLDFNVDLGHFYCHGFTLYGLYYSRRFIGKWCI